ncbi:hypothetical protein OIU79_000639 [Salix purpurea]|uniref:Uncharacterized protein n=1 Tax=Salix purpurea TaxID=77065 RepID=A0A9Q0ZN77_SALPP|nr:hypothetical protein OIU79_000639 [Salix purpurea]
MSVAMSSNVHTASSDPLTPADSTQKISFPTTPLTVSPAGTQLVQSIALVAGTKRKLDFSPDDFQQSDSQLDKSLEKDIEAQASQPTDDLSEKEKTSSPVKKKVLFPPYMSC